MGEKEPRILIVDDDPHVRDSLARLFRRNGIRVSTAVSGTRALARLRRRAAGEPPEPADAEEDDANGLAADGENGLPYDGMFVDLLMPEINGREFIETLRAEDLYPLDRVVVLTAVQHGDNATAYMQYGCAGYCGKPWDNDRILAQVRRLCAGGGLDDRLDALV